MGLHGLGGEVVVGVEEDFVEELVDEGAELGGLTGHGWAVW